MKSARSVRRGWIIATTGIIAAVIYFGAVGLGAFGEDSPNASDTRQDDNALTQQTPGKEPSPPLATIHSSQSEGCTAILANETEPVSDDTVKADLRYLTKNVYRAQFPDGPVHGIGESSCGPIPVVILFVKNQSAEVPAYGPGGTPVMAYVQREFVAF